MDHTDLPTADRDRPDPALVLAALRSRRLPVEPREAQVWVRAVVLGETIASPTLYGLVRNRDELAQIIESVEQAFLAMNGHARPC